MDKEMVCCFVLKAHKTPSRPFEISSFKHILCGDLSFKGGPSKEAQFHRYHILPNGKKRKIGSIPTVIKLLTETLGGERTFRVIWLNNLISAYGNIFILARIAKKSQTLSSSRSLGFLKK